MRKFPHSLWRGSGIRLAASCCVLLGLAYDRARSEQPAGEPATLPAAKAVHSITLPQIAPPAFPDGPGRDQFMISCIMCHTPRYVTMQPAFPKKVWIAEVEKMRKTFGAPMTDEQAAQIVEYLVRIRGTPSPDAAQKR